ncbi:hypothetical protein F7725_020273 [Dissostichus mawsoni]|uniref:Protein kinase domain-containing protein n=1 Tax=Dissostichus mawsoni TaxID=36200 RepID=A0A7J5YCT9_DISMA|nr:hypothetical protein F7725_020273 [Dissostichus mawsoni]
MIGVRPKHVDTEVSIMRKLVHHKNILQLLDWNTTEEPYILIMEYVTYGTLRTFLQTNRAHLSEDPELQSLLTIASYHIALALQHLRSKMIVHCDLALRNIMVNKFPWEQRVPLRWYPPEYFKNNYYGFKGDVWAFGIVLWEMQTFGEVVTSYHERCWLEPYTLRPSFTDIVRMLENIMESDADYVDVESPLLLKEEAEYHEARCLRAAGVTLEDANTV